MGHVPKVRELSLGRAVEAVQKMEKPPIIF